MSPTSWTCRGFLFFYTVHRGLNKGMATSKLQITAIELVKIVNPFGDTNLLVIGDMPPAMTEADVENVIENEEQSILSAMPERYRVVLGGVVDGEYLTSKQYGAAAEQVELYTKLKPVVAGSLLLFKNFTGKPWRARSRADALTAADYTVDTETGKITLTTPLVQGESVIAYYEHTAGRMFTSIRQLVLKAARLELHQMFPNWNGSEAIISAGRDMIDNQIMAYGLGPVPKGIGEIDDIEFVEEPRQGPGIGRTLRLPFLGGRG